MCFFRFIYTVFTSNVPHNCTLYATYKLVIISLDTIFLIISLIWWLCFFPVSFCYLYLTFLSFRFIISALRLCIYLVIYSVSARTKQLSYESYSVTNSPLAGPKYPRFCTKLRIVTFFKTARLCIDPLPSREAENLVLTSSYPKIHFHVGFFIPSYISILFRLFD